MTSAAAVRRASRSRPRGALLLLLAAACSSRPAVARATTSSSSPARRRPRAAFLPPSCKDALAAADRSCRSSRNNDRRWELTPRKSNSSLREKEAAEDNNQSSFAKYGRPQDITADSFGPLLPLAEAVDAATGGWGLSYADLSPATPRTPAGQAFLATNLGYAVVGAWLAAEGDCLYGGLTEAAGLVSFAYHYAQLDLGKNRPEVRLALLVDYLVAGAALLTGTAYLVQDCAAGGAGLAATSGTTLASAAVALGCLGLCWVWEYGYPYIFLHSLWHIASAYTGFLVGQEHLDTIASL